jgi:hypothetical protein
LIGKTKRGERVPPLHKASEGKKIFLHLTHRRLSPYGREPPVDLIKFRGNAAPALARRNIISFHKKEASMSDLLLGTRSKDIGSRAEVTD